jgi:hypothetical protein
MPSQLHEVLLQLLLGPSGIPEITDEEVARADPELAVLSAMAHGKDADTQKSLRIALAAQLASADLDDDRSMLYCDLILYSLSEAARRAFQNMRAFKYEYQSDFAKHYIGLGVEKGLARGRAEIVLRLLTIRFGAPGEDVKARVAAATVAELDAIGERLLTAQTLQEALG